MARATVEIEAFIEALHRDGEAIPVKIETKNEDLMSEVEEALAAWETARKARIAPAKKARMHILLYNHFANIVK